MATNYRSESAATATRVICAATHDDGTLVCTLLALASALQIVATTINICSATLANTSANVSVIHPSSNSTDIVVSASGEYNVSCSASPVPLAANTYVYVVGCASAANSSSSVVHLQLFSAPTQVVISDDPEQLTFLHRSMTLPVLGLAGCSVVVTYLNGTSQPPAGATSPRQAHVFVYSSSVMTSIAILLQSVLYLEGSFVAIAGNYSGSIGTVQINATYGSYVVCRNGLSQSQTGTSLLWLAPGSSHIATLSILVRGTDVSASTNTILGSGFFLINIDNTSSNFTDVPELHMIEIDSVIGSLYSYQMWLTMWIRASIFGNVFSAYPRFDGVVNFINCSIYAPTSALLQFDNPQRLLLALHNITVYGGFFLQLPSGGTTLLCGAVIVDILNSTLSLFNAHFFDTFALGSSSGRHVGVLSMSTTE
ncbi:unnamed protein product [Bodo saltans]|uniref:Uncharacterized protein n=1 Tax=Bodo saltans TaxID=75058 RepID=A0A0S4IZF0_BODSA|nr:unnamed protein product [Bodo saltans]|eukprot:CUG26093.1 unnamed protein product [Bodo saltans]